MPSPGVDARVNTRLQWKFREFAFRAGKPGLIKKNLVKLFQFLAESNYMAAHRQVTSPLNPIANQSHRNPHSRKSPELVSCNLNSL